MQDVFVIALDGTKLMPTNRVRARKLLKKGKAIIYKHAPFTIQLAYESEKNVQPIEFCEDTGAKHIGVSIKSRKHEYVHAQFDHLKDEAKRHRDQRMYRRTRRSRKRYRKSRIDNRRKIKGWLAPTVEHKKNNHVRIFAMFYEVCPISEAVVESGKFDPAALQAIEETGKRLQGTDYQHGKKYALANLRETVFARDHYKCCICGMGVEEGAILQVHHIVYRSKGGTDRINNLLTVCSKCHTPKNHKPGGKLHGLKPVTRSFKDASFMNIVRWAIANEIREKYPNVEVKNTYGAYTKAKRRELGQLEKTHANDAYAMGEFHPRHRHKETHYQKKRRNNRILSKFYDAKYIDIRDGTKKSGAELGCNRTKRSIQRNNPESLRQFHGRKISKGRVSIRRRRYGIQPGDTVRFRRINVIAKGVHSNGRFVRLETGKNVALKNVAVVKRIGGWKQLHA